MAVIRTEDERVHDNAAAVIGTGNAAGHDVVACTPVNEVRSIASVYRVVACAAIYAVVT